jgi:hypothetical protein
MRVFISYAHTEIDRALARVVASRLRAVKIDVWMDESSLPGARHTQQAIEAAAATCGHAVFLVSRSWLERAWTNWELGLFVERTEPAVVVPVWRRPRRQLKLPPQLYQLTGLDWLEGDHDVDARFWQLHCALTDAAPGPADAWSRSGRELTPAASRSLEVPLPTTQVVRPSLRCDRAPQWKTIDDLATSGGSELMLLPGSAGQGHDHFIERVERLMRGDPPRVITRVDWGDGRRPASREEYRDGLARSLGIVPSSDLEAGLGERLAHQNLVLLHPCIRSRFVDDLVVDYYAKWLPEWLSAARPRMDLKCVQPVEWPRESLGAAVMRWVGAGGAADGNARPDADMLLRQLLDKSGDALRAVRLAELHDVSRPELDEFCQIMALKPRQVSWLLDRIGSRRVRSASEVFKAIDDYIPELPDERSIQ